jgi:ubiquinone/menaquinone biosynthesis C-methylase UbiE
VDFAPAMITQARRKDSQARRHDPFDEGDIEQLAFPRDVSISSSVRHVL